MVHPRYLVLDFGLRSIRKHCPLLCFILRLLLILCQIQRLRLGTVLSHVCICLPPALVKLILVLNLPLPFLMREANDYEGFFIILVIISPAQLH
jgi:hypothetical protein